MNRTIITRIFSCTVLAAFLSQPMQCMALYNGQNNLSVEKVAPNAVRIRYQEIGRQNQLPELIYTGKIDSLNNTIRITTFDNGKTIGITDSDGHGISVEHSLSPMQLHDVDMCEATISITPAGGEIPEYQYGLGQFQDGYTNIFGLSRRLTQVNTQISVPMYISNKGYGILWNNYGLTNFNHGDNYVMLEKQQGTGKKEIVDVTSTDGGKQEERENNIFISEIDVPEDGLYSLLLDVGQKMARRHNLRIDDEEVIEIKNIWLPPTASKIVHLTKGKHKLSAELTKDDNPVLYYKKLTDETVLSSPVAECVDYTVFFGTPDEIIASYRTLTGQAPMMPQWALGYIHCRERFHNQDELLGVASRFRKERIPIDVIVQDWQYWGKHGWNAMRFDQDNYPDPKAMTDSLHNMDIRLMVSVWSKIDKNSEVGKDMEKKGYYIPGTDWIDFFSPEAASAYWKKFSNNLLPVGIDAWWQDATEPENDDLTGRFVNNGKFSGELYRNVYPLFVNKTVYEGLMTDNPGKRPAILTRCGFSGIQRYGAILWSGDVGNDWETLRRQISAGLGLQASGLPWWTYDAGGFFRPSDQYTNPDYKKCMLRWIQTAVYLPLMRVHGYMSNTEPWEYGAETQKCIESAINERYRLMPYIYSNAAEVSNSGHTMMRPLIFDFPNDTTAMKQETQYMFGKSLLINPVLQPDVTEWETYLPENKGGWYDFRTEEHFDGGENVISMVDSTFIPVYVRAGSILPYGKEKQHTADNRDKPIEIRIYPGNNADFTLYEDDGTTLKYMDGEHSTIGFKWADFSKELTISDRKGSFEGMPAERVFIISLPGKKKIEVPYNGNAQTIKF